VILEIARKTGIELEEPTEKEVEDTTEPAVITNE